jgi:fused signal recognition particle receptor
MSWLKKLRVGLTKTSSKISDGVAKIFTHKKLDQEALDSLEEVLIQADIGVVLSSRIIESLAEDKFNKEASEIEVKEFLAGKIADNIAGYSKELQFEHSPSVYLFCGVNGNGKTTTAGKIAAKLTRQGKKVMLVACDTFRAAAVDQLKIWADRSNSIFMCGEENADPASVAFQALEKAKKDGVDVVLIDTAGRLHNKSNLMDELAKIIRVIKKVIVDAPHCTILVLDATTGQNALQQVETFKTLVNIDGLIVTKLDGTAKGGVVVAIVDKFKMPIYALGVGEGVDDLNSFLPSEYAKAIVGLN